MFGYGLRCVLYRVTRRLIGSGPFQDVRGDDVAHVVLAIREQSLYCSSARVIAIFCHATARRGIDLLSVIGTNPQTPSFSVACQSARRLAWCFGVRVRGSATNSPDVCSESV